MESWRVVWRKGFGPLLPIKGLEALRDALAADDPRLTQGSTTTPPPLMCVQDWPCEAADALGYCGWKGEGLVSVGDVEEFFAKACFNCDQICGEPAACRWFLNWFDDTPRGEMRRELLTEVALALLDRADLAGIVPADFADAYAAAPDDRTMMGVIADWCDKHGDAKAAEAWRHHMQKPVEVSQ